MFNFKDVILNFKLMMKSKRAYSTGFAWVFALISMFGIGLLYIIFNQVFLAYVVPLIKNQVNSTNTLIPIEEATKIEIFAGIDKYITFFHMVPFILFFIIILYMILTAMRKEREGDMIG